MKITSRILAFILVLVITVSICGCSILQNPPSKEDIEGVFDEIGDSFGDLNDSLGNIVGGKDNTDDKNDGGSTGNNGEEDEDDKDVTFPEGDGEIADSGIKSPTAEDAIPANILLGGSCDLNALLPDGVESEGLTWRSDCDAVVSVNSNGAIKGNKVGRTEVYAYSGDDIVSRFLITVEFLVNGTGFDFSTTKIDETVHKVSSLYEANRLLDSAIANHYRKLTIDFSDVKADFHVSNDFDLDSEFGNHTSIKMVYYPSTSYKVEFEIIYNKDAATYTKPTTEQYTYDSVDSLNAMVHRAYAYADGGCRADDYEGFAINSRTDEMPVYNSEELWWAVEHGYKPTFPMSNTKAELFYERAKMILREIITDNMTEYEKVLAIYDYLIEAVSYDYDSYYTSSGDESEKNNTCYFLEGVFEAGRAVCDGKTKAFVLLCGIEGIDCVRAFGESLKGGAGHAWNYVELGGIWYLVDTTEGDARYEDSSQISQFFGGKFEVVSYETFLRSAYYHSAKYTYTEMWADLLPAVESGDFPVSYFNANLGDSSCNFKIECKEEFYEIFELTHSYGLSDEFFLVFIPKVESDAYGYFAGIEAKYGYELKLYTSSYGSERVFIALFKNAD